MTSANKNPGSLPNGNDASRCPLCGGPNECRVCTADTYKSSCWCATVEIPAELLVCVPAEQRNRACICRNCVTTFQRERSVDKTQVLRSGEFYFEPGGAMVFTTEYLLKRGHCCDSGCRHCPYPAAT